MVVLRYALGNHWQRLLHISQHGNIGIYNLVNLGRVNLQVYHFGVDTKLGRISRHAVIETHTDSNQKITIAVFDVRAVVAVHAEHADIEWVIAWKSRQAE